MTNRVVLIGHPVAHSFSGAMQQAALDALGVDARYELWDRRQIDLADAIAQLRGDEFLGANITIPHKEHVVPLVDRLTEDAQATGAVNVISREGKKLIGHNTDVPGFKVALDKLVGRQKMPLSCWAPAARREQLYMPSSPTASRGSWSSIATCTGARGWSGISAGVRPTWISRPCRGMSRSWRPSYRRPRFW